MRTWIALALLLLATTASAAPPADYLIWVYQDSPEYIYVLRNYKWNRKTASYTAEYTCRNELTGAVLGQEAFYPDGFYFWLPGQWPNGAWDNAETRFHTIQIPGQQGGGSVVAETNELPAWAVGLPDFYEW